MVEPAFRVAALLFELADHDFVVAWILAWAGALDRRLRLRVVAQRQIELVRPEHDVAQSFLRTRDAERAIRVASRYQRSPLDQCLPVDPPCIRKCVALVE